MPDRTKKLFVLSSAQKAIVDAIVQRWQKRLDLQRRTEPKSESEGRSKVTFSDVVRGGLKIIAEKEGLPWPEDVTWGGVSQPSYDDLFPSGDIFIQRTADGHAIIAHYTWDADTGQVGQEPAQNWRELEELALLALDEIEGGLGRLVGEHPCPPAIAEQARWP